MEPNGQLWPFSALRFPIAWPYSSEIVPRRALHRIRTLADVSGGVAGVAGGAMDEVAGASSRVAAGVLWA